ncbi:ClpP/crotonase-like domain-containing protein [Aspergillus cavernicola]|uniref:ClpP/crotonase-like domain-containing protein n=1 Tax=Aspergillus cavernicola TaxID=176166 RepID=A0ABR4I210_9EURO
MPYFTPPPIEIPSSYESLPTKHIKVSHYPVASETATPVVIVTLNRPEKRNAFTAPMSEDLEKVFAMFDRDERVRVVILTGAGNTFCAGADLEIGFHAPLEERAKDHRDSGGRVALAIHRCRKPTIAAMQGSAVGVGMTMTLPAAIRIAHETSKYGFVFARRGITMESCSSYFLPRLIGHSRANYLVATGAVYPATSPHFGSLFAETMPEQTQVLPRALAIASDIAENVSPQAAALNRELMWRGPAGSAEEAHLLESDVIYHRFISPDQKEGVTAFFEKRKPRFTGDVDRDQSGSYPWWADVKIDPPSPVKGGSKL